MKRVRDRRSSLAAGIDDRNADDSVHEPLSKGNALSA